uniref:Uncharacterized protein n=1 Tax=Brassica oleracea TaxID=3712 RepID=A0A3P6ECQ5_BRAOL|nr:unnamed protein product [Brassica oleracea]
MWGVWSNYVPISALFVLCDMPPKRRVLRTQAARATREDGDSYVLPPVPPQAVLPIDQDVLRQMVQDAATQTT